MQRQLTLLAALVCGGLGTYLMWPLLAASDPPLEIEQVDWDLGVMEVGKCEIAIRIANPAAAPRRVIGLTSGCSHNCCHYPKVSSEVVIPAGETIEYICMLDVKRAGPFNAEITLFLEENGYREVALTVHGVGAAAEEQADEPPDQP